MIILFLDGNEATRDTRTDALRQQQDWTVIPAASVLEARARLTEATALDLFITEAILDSGSSTFDLRDEVLSRFPEAKILFTTRYDLSGFDAQIGGWPILNDAPYSNEKLVARAQEALVRPAPEPVTPPPFLAPGTIIGNYQILERSTWENESETYRAIQTTVQRPVALVLLRPDLMDQPEVVAEFKARERLKASISHPRIAPLYEAGSENGLLFYTRELPRGRSLEEIRASGEHLSERRVAELLHGVAEAIQHAVERGFYHRRLHPRDIFVDDENQASIVNIFRPANERSRIPIDEVRALLQMVMPIAAEGKAHGLLQSLLENEHDWSDLLAELDDVREAMRERSIMRRIEAEEDRAGGTNKTPWWVWATSLAAIAVVAALGALAGKSESTAPAPRDQEMVVVPAGPFVYQKRQKITLPAFWISKHEVSIGQYGEFLTAIGSLPVSHTFDHPNQPKTKTGHEPAKWDETYAAAKAGATFNGQPISLNTPVTQVDWWDAYAYARWKGQRLPTEEEWEKTARGEKGFAFPWGNQSDPAAANLGDDYDATGPKGGQKDGYNLWAPINRKTKDISPFGACDMLGNVAEWTATEHKDDPWPAHPDYPDLRVPVVRGGHFAQKSSPDLLTLRRFAESPNEANLARGFRTASDRAPHAP